MRHLMRSMCLPGTFMFISSIVWTTVAEQPDWENEKVFGRNTEAPGAASLVYPTEQAAVANQRATNPWFHSLNGPWKFRWSADPDHRPADFYRVEFDVTPWYEVAVPGNWQLQGFDVPLYSKIQNATSYMS